MQLAFRTGGVGHDGRRTASRRGRSSVHRRCWMDGLLRHLLKGSAHSEALAEPLPGGVSSDIFRVHAGRNDVLRQAGLTQTEGRCGLAGAGRAQSLRGRVDAGGRRHRPRRGARPSSPRTPRRGPSRWPWLPPERYPVWKAQLRDGILDPRMAGAVGDALGRIHAATADDDEVARRFPTDAVFHAIRLEPYLVATARAHPDLADRLYALVGRTAATKRVLVHGDYSPKNLLAGPDGPVILDAECAWFGDPAFDLAFVLNHLLLKGAWKRHWRSGYLHLFGVLVDAYRRHVRWEPWEALDARTAALLPGLLLGRVDGKSPVEYLTGEADREAVRAFARERIAAPPGDAGRPRRGLGASTVTGDRHRPRPRPARLRLARTPHGGGGGRAARRRERPRDRAGGCVARLPRSRGPARRRARASAASTSPAPSPTSTDRSRARFSAPTPWTRPGATSGSSRSTARRPRRRSAAMRPSRCRWRSPMPPPPRSTFRCGGTWPAAGRCRCPCRRCRCSAAARTPAGASTCRT